jgi:formylglycine-generating enzyme required for sulfatase activity
MPEEANRLMATIESAHATLDERIGAAHALAAIGDPRVLLPNAVPIPAAPSVVGRAGLQRYAIDRFPVTVAAYATFIDAGGYRDPSYWSDAGWAWRKSLAIEQPRFWGEKEWAAYLVPNHPVVGVSFYEAEAYAAFRGARLPTEAEWERAAGGTDGRKYPWGNDWREDACGMRGVGPRSTVPVGVFPKGASPYGVRDMVGCVWQWCVDPFLGWGGSPEPRASGDMEADEPVRRTTCGGAWNTLAWSVTCQSRNGYPSSARFSNLGFRCVTTWSEGARE